MPLAFVQPCHHVRFPAKVTEMTFDPPVPQDNGVVLWQLAGIKAKALLLFA